jgi:hypothetical protein
MTEIDDEQPCMISFEGESFSYCETSLRKAEHLRFLIRDNDTGFSDITTRSLHDLLRLRPCKFTELTIKHETIDGTFPVQAVTQLVRAAAVTPTQIKRFCIYEIDQLTGEETAWRELGQTMQTVLKGLEEVDCSGYSGSGHGVWPDTFVQSLCSIPTMRKLALGKPRVFRGILPRTLTHLSNIPNLLELNLFQMFLSDEHIEALSRTLQQSALNLTLRRLDIYVEPLTDPRESGRTMATMLRQNQSISHFSISSGSRPIQDSFLVEMSEGIKQNTTIEYVGLWIERSNVGSLARRALDSMPRENYALKKISVFPLIPCTRLFHSRWSFHTRSTDFHLKLNQAGRGAIMQGRQQKPGPGTKGQWVNVMIRAMEIMEDDPNFKLSSLFYFMVHNPLLVAGMQTFKADNLTQDRVVRSKKRPFRDV